MKRRRKIDLYTLTDDDGDTYYFKDGRLACAICIYGETAWVISGGTVIDNECRALAFVAGAL